jgi:hypothetical protein
MSRLADISAAHSSAAVVSRLESSLAIRIQRAVDPQRAAAWAAGVRDARADWVTDFDGEQFSLGRAWYTHLEQDRADAYFANVATSDASVERRCPGLQLAMRSLMSRVVGGHVSARAGWCGPGVHVFPAGAHVAKHGGDVHFDTEGLTPAHVAERAPGLTLVLMLAPPESGGGLRVWDVLYAGSDAYEDEDLEKEYITCDYAVGDLVVIDSYRLHQIQPFSGTSDRISATCHASFVAGQWETWF